jgi:tRNA A-37 threonylcarbamoyl transferase component Bud32
VGACLARLLLVVLVVLACCGCARQDDVIELTQWTLVTRSEAPRAVTLPAHFRADQMTASREVVLEADVRIPPAWEGRTLTLAIPRFAGEAALEADGTPRLPRETALSHAWPLDPLTPVARPLHLRLRLNTGMDPHLGVAPRLSPTTEGDAVFLLVRNFNVASTYIGMAMVGLVAIVYVALFAFDRRRSAHGWFAVQAGMVFPVASYPIWSHWAHPDTYAVNAVFAVVANVGTLRFLQTYFHWPRLHRGLWFALAGSGLGAVLQFPSDTRATGLLAGIACLITLHVGIIVLLLREIRTGRDPFAPTAFVVGWLIVVVIYGQESGGVLFASTDLASGMIGVPTALGVYALIQSIVLGRDHVRSLRDSEARVKELEAQRHEVDALNDELRRQVAERSRELTEALARSEGSVAPAALEPGDVFDGRYRVTRALGRGGMGAVYEVERTRDGKRLALKVVTAAMSSKHAARFAREAEIGARLQHENLVSIVDVGIAVGATPFLVMELVQGGSLEDKRTRFGDAAWARPIVRQIAAGLAELHANRVVHRDLKPGNVLLVENGGGSTSPLAKISDFGISRFGALDDSGDVDAKGATVSPGAHSPSPRDLTETGALMGTPVYMPPEAWFGPARHPSADVFSLGVLAYEALTGRSPFAVPPVLLVRSRQPIPTPAPLDGVDARIASVVLACLHVEPSDRPRAKELVEVLS